jgi:peptidoglycan hydrolase CwlO-like protein
MENLNIRLEKIEKEIEHLNKELYLCGNKNDFLTQKINENIIELTHLKLKIDYGRSRK